MSIRGVRNLPHYIDINSCSHHKATPFIGNISTYDVWEQVLNYVNDNGKFDFAICTHTLEDISSPQMVCNLLPRIAKEGYIAVPSKYMELSRHEGYSPCSGYIGGCGGYRGWVHHRWIFNKEGNDFVAYPKIPLTEYIDLSNMKNRTEQDLRFFWKDSFELKVVNNDWLGPTDAAVRDLYKIAFLKD